MRAIAIPPLTLFLLHALAFGQTSQERVFQLQSRDTAGDAQEIATVLRGIGNISELTADTAKQTLTVKGTEAQLALSEWLFKALDKSVSQAQDSSKKEYRMSVSGDDVVAIFSVQNATAMQQLQEIATAVRSITDITRLFTYNEPRVVVARGNASQIALATWLFRQMDKPGVGAGAAQSQESGTNEFRNPAGGDDIVRVFYLTNTPAVPDFQELVVLIRSTTGIRRAFTYSAPRALVVHGSAEQIALAAWLANELDTRATHGQGFYEYKAPENLDDVVRVFYLDPAESVAAFQKRVTDMRTTVNLRRVFTYNGPRAVAVRGTSNEITWADQLLTAK